MDCLYSETVHFAQKSVEISMKIDGEQLGFLLRFAVWCAMLTITIKEKKASEWNGMMFMIKTAI